MQITIKKLIAEQLKKTLETLRIEQENYGDTHVELSSLTRSQCERLRDAIHNSGLRGTKIVVADVNKYLRAEKDGVDREQARSVRQAAWLLEMFIGKLPNHVIFSEDEYGGGSHSGYWVGDVDYRPENRRDNSYTPAAVEIELFYVHNDRRKCKSLELESGDTLMMTPEQILKKAGYVVETPALMAKLKAETELFYVRTGQIGKQFTAVGYGMDDLTSDEDRSDRYRSRERVRLDNHGIPARVLVDILNEKDDSDSGRGSDHKIDPYRWHEWNYRFFAASEDKLARHLEADEDTAEPPDTIVPVHPTVPTFDLRRHKRLSVHVNNLTEYEYRKASADNLVLPERDWKMVNLLVEHSRNTFQDIVSGKGQSMNILSEGPPGTGKTVTAEVFAEFKERPLYTVQCSQLGVDAEEVETNLLLILTRANRWNAVLLLDEADVYIRKRGDDMGQNAVVGAFLRVLEYASCILFLTTNIPENVDDAIASRCIARLSYHAPGADGQAKIWHNLARVNGLSIPPEDVAAICAAHPKLTGRDVKNLLKLASFISKKPKVTREHVELALQFKPA